MSSWELSNSFWGILFTSKTYYAVYLLLRDVKLFLRDSIYNLYINTVYLLLRDAKRLMRDSIYKLDKNSTYLLLMDAKLLLRDSVYKLYVNL